MNELPRKPSFNSLTKKEILKGLIPLVSLLIIIFFIYEVDLFEEQPHTNNPVLSAAQEGEIDTDLSTAELNYIVRVDTGINGIYEGMNDFLALVQRSDAHSRPWNDEMEKSIREIDHWLSELASLDAPKNFKSIEVDILAAVYHYDMGIDYFLLWLEYDNEDFLNEWDDEFSKGHNSLSDAGRKTNRAFEKGIQE